MKPGMRCGVALAVGSLLLAMPTVASADNAGPPMTTTQARKVYLKTVCPMNRAIEALTEAEDATEANWATVQPLLLQVADLQIRTANKLESPDRAWPKNVQKYMPAVIAIDRTGAGSNYLAAKAASLAEYVALLEAFQAEFPPTLNREIKKFVKARRIISKRLDLPEKDACKGV